MRPLAIKELYHKCDTKLFDFKTTKELHVTENIVGQKRALDAVDFSTDIKQDGFNLFAMGPNGSGKHSVIKNYLEKKSQDEPTPDDWCYVNNFKDPLKPTAIRFSTGKAAIFKRELDESIDILSRMLPEVFESDEYRNAKNTIAQRYIDLQDALFIDLQTQAEKYQIAIKTSSAKRVTFAPIMNGKILAPEEYQALTGKDKERINANMNQFEDLVSKVLFQVGELGKEMQKEFKDLDKQMSANVVNIVISELRQHFKDIEPIIVYLDDLQEDIIDNVKDFLFKPDEMGGPAFLNAYYKPSLDRYKVNILISHEASKNEAQPSVIFESNPTYQNLIGRIEYNAQMEHCLLILI